MGNQPSRKANSLRINVPKLEKSKSISNESSPPATATAEKSKSFLSVLRAPRHSQTPVSFKPSGTDSPLSSFILQHESKAQDTDCTLTINNGICGKYLSQSICRIAALFWQRNVDQLSSADQLEIGCSILFAMMSSNLPIKKILQRVNGGQKIEQLSMKLVSMIRWITRMLVTDNIDLYALLTTVGKYHLAMGVSAEYFGQMLHAMHDTFCHYFDVKYTIEVKYAFDEIFAVACKIMTGCSLKPSSHSMDLDAQFQGNDIPFLKSLDVCLHSNIGREYLYRYLQQTWCDEMVIFLQTLSRFKSLPSDKERFMVARDIVSTSIEPEATFSLNLSYSTRADTLCAMQVLEKKFVGKETALNVAVSFFDEVEAEIYKLIIENHWKEFVDSIVELHSQRMTTQSAN